MKRAPVDGIELEYEIRGTGDPVVLMHAGVCADFFRPLADEEALAAHHTVLRYHRTGYAGSDRIDGPVSFADQARHCRAVMGHVGIERAHIVGHSSSASMALQLAPDDSYAQKNLGRLLLRDAQSQAEGKKLLRQLADGSAPGLVPPSLVGWCHFLLGNNEAAEQWLTVARSTEPNDISVMFDLALTRFAAKNYDTATADYRQALEVTRTKPKKRQRGLLHVAIIDMVDAAAERRIVEQTGER